MPPTTPSRQEQLDCEETGSAAEKCERRQQSNYTSSSGGADSGVGDGASALSLLLQQLRSHLGAAAARAEYMAVGVVFPFLLVARPVACHLISTSAEGSALRAATHAAFETVRLALPLLCAAAAARRGRWWKTPGLGVLMDFSLREEEGHPLSYPRTPFVNACCCADAAGVAAQQQPSRRFAGVVAIVAALRFLLALRSTRLVLARLERLALAAAEDFGDSSGDFACLMTVTRGPCVAGGGWGGFLPLLRRELGSFFSVLFIFDLPAPLLRRLLGALPSATHWVRFYLGAECLRQRLMQQLPGDSSSYLSPAGGFGCLLGWAFLLPLPSGLAAVVQYAKPRQAPAAAGGVDNAEDGVDGWQREEAAVAAAAEQSEDALSAIYNNVPRAAGGGRNAAKDRFLRHQQRDANGSFIQAARDRLEGSGGAALRQVSLWFGPPPLSADDRDFIASGGAAFADNVRFLEWLVARELMAISAPALETRRLEFVGVYRRVAEECNVTIGAGTMSPYSFTPYLVPIDTSVLGPLPPPDFAEFLKKDGFCRQRPLLPSADDVVSRRRARQEAAAAAQRQHQQLGGETAAIAAGGEVACVGHHIEDLIVVPRGGAAVYRFVCNSSTQHPAPGWEAAAPPPPQQPHEPSQQLLAALRRSWAPLALNYCAQEGGAVCPISGEVLLKAPAAEGRQQAGGQEEDTRARSLTEEERLRQSQQIFFDNIRATYVALVTTGASWRADEMEQHDQGGQQAAEDVKFTQTDTALIAFPSSHRRVHQPCVYHLGIQSLLLARWLLPADCVCARLSRIEAALGEEVVARSRPARGGGAGDSAGRCADDHNRPRLPGSGAEAVGLRPPFAAQRHRRRCTCSCAGAGA